MALNVTHLINGLDKGGAETMLYQVLRHQATDDISYSVISLGIGNYYEDKINELGVPLSTLRLKRKPIRSILKIRKLIKQSDVLCCWMYHANFIGYIASLGIRNTKKIWCIRHSNLDPKNNSKPTLFINKFCAAHSNKVDVIAYNGEQARTVHEEMGYDREKGVVLNNGCDLSEYSPQNDAREKIRCELGIEKNAKIVLSVARYVPIKDIPTFVQAYSKVHNTIPNTIAVMCGNGIQEDNTELRRIIQDNELKIGRDVYLLGLRHDIPTLMSACDLYILHSAGEAFPNTLIQAMACGACCVATNVGEASCILGRANDIVEPGNVDDLAKCIIEKMCADEESKDRESKENRLRVESFYGIDSVVREYERLFKERSREMGCSE